MRITRAAFSVSVLLVMATAVFAQDRKPLSPDERTLYVVSAKAGAVNVVEGDAFSKRGGSDWNPLLEGDDLRTGDSVRTGADGRIEILLSPGSFLRLAENSEFTFSSTSVYNLKLNIVKGSAIVEASAVDSPIRVTAGQSQFSIVQNGLYRFSVDEDGKSEALVRKGRIIFAGGIVKDGKKITVAGGGSPLITAFDSKLQDSFDIWSKDRAQTIIAANRKLSSRAIRQSVSSLWAGNLWLFDPFSRSFTFLPYGSGFNSPYGYGYRTCNPSNDWRNGYYGNRNGGGTYGGNNGSTGSSRGNGSGRTSPTQPVGRGGADRPSSPSFPGAGSGGGNRPSAPPMTAPRIEPGQGRGRNK